MNTTVLVPDRVFTGDPWEPVLTGMAIRVKSGRIAEVLPHSDAGEAILDLTGCTLLPGLIDSHVHLVLPGDGSDPEAYSAHLDGLLLLTAARSARTLLHHGVTTARDCGGKQNVTLDLQKAIHARISEGPRILVCGCPLTATGGHCHFFGGECDGPEAARLRTRQLLKAGADFIKVMASGGGTKGTSMYHPSLTVAELRAMTEEAHQRARRITAHAMCAEAVRRALGAGVDGLEHALPYLPDASWDPDSERLFAAVAERDIPVTCTPQPAYHLWSQAVEDRSSESPRWRRSLDFNLRAIREQLAAGIRVIPGSDAGWRNTPYNQFYRSLLLMVEAGASPRTALLSATSRAAEALGLQSETGRIQVGLSADLVAVEGDPTLRLQDLTQVRMVMQEGTVVRWQPALKEN